MLLRSGIGRRRKRSLPTRPAIVVSTLGVAAAALLYGFILFATTVMRTGKPLPGRADGIVVLTGEHSRIKAGARLLNEGRGARLLISGVNRRIGREELKRLTGLDPARFECCVDIGYVAADTSGNAGEAHAWAGQRRYRSLIIVTSSYHMPRSLAELSHAMPGHTLIPYPVRLKSLAVEAWWLNPLAARLLAEEYMKYLSSIARLSLARHVRSPSADAVAASHAR